MVYKTRRIRDPIHGLIKFEKNSPTDMLAWELMQTPEFQRLRRIKQLGVTELVYPSATHTRFAHSIGVYHNARKLMEIIKRELKEKEEKFKEERAEIVLLAALLHDIGHGPFSHAFENARETIANQRQSGPIIKHEKFSAMIIEAENGNIQPLLQQHRPNLACDIARLLETDDPVDFYHAVVSSSFDADRLDYLKRDRYMTGTHTGAIDDVWLLDNLKTHDISIRQEDDDEVIKIPTFIFKQKALHAAEDFLLARYRLHHQVYFHKVTRGFEKLISGLFNHIGSDDTDKAKLGIDENHPLLLFLAQDGDTLENYKRLDDIVVWAAIERLSQCEDKYAANLASRLWNREPLKVIDVISEIEARKDDQENAVKRLKSFCEDLKEPYFQDELSFNMYTDIGGEGTKQHKKVRCLKGGHEIQIGETDDTIISKGLKSKQKIIRFYFLNADDKEQASKALRGD